MNINEYQWMGGILPSIWIHMDPYGWFIHSFYHFQHVPELPLSACVEVLLLVPPERGVSRVFAPLLAPWKTPWAPVFRSLDGSTSSAAAWATGTGEKPWRNHGIDERFRCYLVMLALEVRIFGGFCFATMNVWPFQWWLCGLRLLFRRGGLYTTAVVRQGLDVLFGTPKHRPWFFPPLTLGLIGWLWPIWFVIFGSRLRVDCGLDRPLISMAVTFSKHIPKFIWGSVWHIHLAHSFAAGHCAYRA